MNCLSLAIFQRMGSIRLFLQWVLCGLLVVTLSQNSAHGQSVAAGAGLYGAGAGGFNSACSGCHFGNAAPDTTPGVAAAGRLLRTDSEQALSLAPYLLPEPHPH